MKAKELDFSALTVVGRLPNWRGASNGRSLPDGLNGATIVRFGTISADECNLCTPRPQGGGLVIDYVPRGSDAITRVVLSFDETEMWTTWCEQIQPVGSGGAID
jgi:hypothetical protein